MIRFSEFSIWRNFLLVLTLTWRLVTFVAAVQQCSTIQCIVVYCMKRQKSSGTLYPLPYLCTVNQYDCSLFWLLPNFPIWRIQLFRSLNYLSSNNIRKIWTTTSFPVGWRLTVDYFAYDENLKNKETSHFHVLHPSKFPFVSYLSFSFSMDFIAENIRFTYDKFGFSAMLRCMQ